MSAELSRPMQRADTTFPNAGFAFAGGLETLVAEGAAGPAAVEALLGDQIAPPRLDFDRWFLAAAHGASDVAALVAIDRDCEVRQTVEPLGDASRRQGRATLATHARFDTPGAAAHLVRVGEGAAPGHAAVAQGLAAVGLGLPLAPVEAAAFHAALSGFAGAAVRLGALDAQGGPPSAATSRADADAPRPQGRRCGRLDIAGIAGSVPQAPPKPHENRRPPRAATTAASAGPRWTFSPSPAPCTCSPWSTGSAGWRW
jgi:urease accessory protein